MRFRSRSRDHGSAPARVARTDGASTPSTGKRAKRWVIVLIAAVCGAGVARAEVPQALLERYKCNFCHSETEAGTGPSFSDVSARYHGNPQAAAILMAAVRKGAHGSGPWHMPPHPEVSDADAETLVRYILSVRQ